MATISPLILFLIAILLIGCSSQTLLKDDLIKVQQGHKVKLLKEKY